MKPKPSAKPKESPRNVRKTMLTKIASWLLLATTPISWWRMSLLLCVCAIQLSFRWQSPKRKSINFLLLSKSNHWSPKRHLHQLSKSARVKTARELPSVKIKRNNTWYSQLILGLLLVSWHLYQER